MLSTLDRYLLRSLMVNYLIGLGVMLSLYVVLDMFVNMDEFTEQGYSLPVVVGNIASYYWPNLFLYFSQLCGAITLFACMATIARMRKLNEMTAILASGVSLYRVAIPVIGFGIATTALQILDTEWWIPHVAHKLARDHDDVDGKKTFEVLFVRDGNDALVSSRQFHPTRYDLQDLLVLVRDESGAISQTLEADRAVWVAPHGPGPIGRWRLERGRKVSRMQASAGDLGPRSQKLVTYPKYFETDLTPEVIQLRQASGWVRFLSLDQLGELEERDGPMRSSAVRTRHARIVAPFVNIVLVMLGLPFFLSRSPATVLSDAGKCMIACGMCYVSTFIAQSLHTESSSALPAWAPIFVFGTAAVVLIDRIRT
ncbi:MAG: LptF/LptG family permease [Phycisphaerae bacterium]|jgi:lipopolysaccharide export system permease protein